MCFSNFKQSNQSISNTPRPPTSYYQHTCLSTRPRPETISEELVGNAFAFNGASGSPLSIDTSHEDVIADSYGTGNMTNARVDRITNFVQHSKAIAKYELKDKWYRVQIVTGTGSEDLVPATLTKNAKGLSLKLYDMLHIGIDSKIQLEAKIGNAEGIESRTAYIDFHNDQTPSLFTQVTLGEFIVDPNPKYANKGYGSMLLSFVYNAPPSTGSIYLPDPTWSSESKEALAIFADWRKVKTGSKVALKVILNGPDRRTAFVNLVEALKTPAKTSLFPFRSKIGKARVMFGDLFHPEELEKFKYLDGTEYRVLQFPAKNSFRDIEEYIIYQANGIEYEYQYNRLLHSAIENAEHQTSFIIITKDIVLAKVKLSGDIEIQDLVLNKHTTFEINFDPVGVPYMEERQKCRAIPHNDLLHIGDRDDLILLVINKSASNFDDMASVYPDISPQAFPARIRVSQSSNHISRKLAALMNMRKSTRWNQLLLNEHACVGNVSDPSRFSRISDNKKEEVMESVLRRLNPNEEQRESVLGARAMVSLATITTGSASSGKTLTGVAAMQYYLEIDMPVLVIAPTNVAADRVVDTFHKFQSTGVNVPEEIQPIRLHRWTEEEKFSKSYGSELRPVQELKAYQIAFDKQYERNPTKYVDEIEIFNEAKEADQKKAFQSSEDSLAAITLQKASEGKETMMGYPEGIEVGSIFSLRKPKVDLFAKLRDYLKKLETASIETFTEDEHRFFSQLFLKCAQGVLKDRKLLVTTPWMATHPVVKDFASNAPAMVVLFDEMESLLDADILLPLLGSAFSTKIQGAMFTGDGHRNKRLILSQNTKGSKINPFALQLGRTLVMRLKESGYRVKTLR